MSQDTSAPIEEKSGHFSTGTIRTIHFSTGAEGSKTLWHRCLRHFSTGLKRLRHFGPMLLYTVLCKCTNIIINVG